MCGADQGKPKRALRSAGRLNSRCGKLATASYWMRVDGGRVEGVQRSHDVKRAEGPGMKCVRMPPFTGLFGSASNTKDSRLGLGRTTNGQGVEIAHFKGGDRGALGIAHDDDVVARGGLRHDCVVQYRDALLHRLTEGFAVEAGNRPELLGRLSGPRSGVAGVILGEVRPVQWTACSYVALGVGFPVPPMINAMSVGDVWRCRRWADVNCMAAALEASASAYVVLRGVQGLHELVLKRFRPRAERLILLGVRVQQRRRARRYRIRSRR